MVDAIVDYRQSLEKYPVRSEVASGYLAERLPDQAPETPETMEEIMADVQEHIMPGMTHWQHPNFYACVGTCCVFSKIMGLVHAQKCLPALMGMCQYSARRARASGYLHSGRI